MALIPSPHAIFPLFSPASGSLSSSPGKTSPSSSPSTAPLLTITNSRSSLHHHLIFSFFSFDQQHLIHHHRAPKSTTINASCFWSSFPLPCSSRSSTSNTISSCSLAVAAASQVKASSPSPNQHLHHLLTATVLLASSSLLFVLSRLIAASLRSLPFSIVNSITIINFCLLSLGQDQHLHHHRSSTSSSSLSSSLFSVLIIISTTSSSLLYPATGCRCFLYRQQRWVAALQDDKRRFLPFSPPDHPSLPWFSRLQRILSSPASLPFQVG